MGFSLDHLLCSTIVKTTIGSSSLFGCQPTRAASELEVAFSTMNLDLNDDQWYMDSGATTHLNVDPGKISIPSVSSVKFVVVGNGE